MDNRLDKVYNWLLAADPWVKYKETLKQRHKRTGAWLVTDSEYLFTWRTRTESFLWLHGIPGCGKTVLSTVVIEAIVDFCESDPTRGAAFFFFDFIEEETQGVAKLLRSLIKQYSHQPSIASQELQRLYTSTQATGRQHTLDELLTTLRWMLTHFNDSYIVIDALDECSNPEEREKLLDVLAETESWDSSKLHLLVTSRTKADI